MSLVGLVSEKPPTKERRTESLNKGTAAKIPSKQQPTEDDDEFVFTLLVCDGKRKLKDKQNQSYLRYVNRKLEQRHSSENY